MTPSPEAQLPRALTLPDGGGPSRLLPAALLAALVLHLFVLLSLSIGPPRTAPRTDRDLSLEILLIKEAGESTRHPEPDAVLSQRSRVGESPRGDSVVSLPEDLPPLPTDTPTADLPPELAPRAEPAAPPPPPPRTDRLKARPKPKPPVPPKEATPLPTEPPPMPDAARILASRDREIARLTESLEARSASYASRQRRKSVSASTREFRYASYLGAWAAKVERIGNLNYPQAAKTHGLYGNLILSVSVRADGSVETVRLVRSSGHTLLDEAAIRIVELAAPYSPFPPDIAAETDVLDIVRTWQFLRGGRFGGE